MIERTQLHRDAHRDLAVDPRAGTSVPARVFAAALVLFGGCAGTAPYTAAGSWDKPVPKEAPRATVTLRVDLRASQKCEEDFDLAMYEERAIELIEWDGHRGACKGRVVHVRYLTEAASADKVLGLAAKFAETAVVSHDADEGSHE